MSISPFPLPLVFLSGEEIYNQMYFFIINYACTLISAQNKTFPIEQYSAIKSMIQK